MIDYYLAHDTNRPVTIEVFDSAGTLARRVSSTDAGALHAGGARARADSHVLDPDDAGAGGQRRIAPLDLGLALCDAPRTAARLPDLGRARRYASGAARVRRLIPGVYRVRLSIGAHQWEQPLIVNPDPRVKISAADFAAQFELAQRLAGALDSSTAAVLEARSLRAQLKDRTSHASGALADQIQALDHRIGELLEPPEDSDASQPGLTSVNGNFATLYTQVTGADAAPTAVLVADTDHCLKDWQGLKQRWQRVRDEEVAGLNKDLAKASLPALKPELAPPQEADTADEE